MEVEELMKQLLVEKLREVIDEEERDEEDRVLLGDPNAPKPQGVIQQK